MKKILLVLVLVAFAFGSKAAESALPYEVLWGDEKISLDNIIPYYRNLTFQSTEPTVWELYRKVLNYSTKEEEWYKVDSTLGDETKIWTLIPQNRLAYLPITCLRYTTEVDGHTVTPFKLVRFVNGVREEKEFLWDVNPAVPQLKVLSWTFDLNVENRTCENSEMKLEFKCEGQLQYKLYNSKWEKYFKLPEDMAEVRYMYSPFYCPEETWIDTCPGQWGWIMYLEAINSFGTTRSPYYLSNDYITDPAQWDIIKQWDPDINVAVEEIDADNNCLYSLDGRTLTLSDSVRVSSLYDTTGAVCCIWSAGGSYDLTDLPSGLYILTIEDKSLHSESYKILLR